MKTFHNYFKIEKKKKVLKFKLPLQKEAKKTGGKARVSNFLGCKAILKNEEWLKMKKDCLESDEAWDYYFNL